MQITIDPGISEWDNPPAAMRVPTKWGQTGGTETSKYPQEEKTTVISQVVASERERAQTGDVAACPGLRTPKSRKIPNWNGLGRPSAEGERPVQARN